MKTLDKIKKAVGGSIKPPPTKAEEKKHDERREKWLKWRLKKNGSSRMGKEKST